ncbi:glycosyltransferase [Pseudomonadota bacterium]
MKIAFLNAVYRHGTTSGGNAHVAQFVSNVVKLGHKIWMEPGHPHPLARRLPQNNLAQYLREMDAVYVRLEYGFPGICRRVISQDPSLFQAIPLVWEFNVPLSYATLKGCKDSQVRQTVELFKRYAAQCELAVCVSNALRNYVSENLGLRRVITVPNGSDPTLFRPDIAPIHCIKSGPDHFNVVWIGSAYLAWHNFDLVRQAAQLLWDMHPEVRITFYIIGKGLPGIQDMPPNVRYCGPVAYRRLPTWLAAMDIGLALYRPGPADLNSPLKLFDYMASGLTVIGSEHPQLREVFAEMNQLDLLIAGDDYKSLCGKLVELSFDRNRVREQGRVGRRLAMEKYNWQETAGMILAEIDRCSRRIRT